jgi:phospholipase C
MEVYQDRCGYGSRLILLAISPFSKANHIDHRITDQTSILRFIEDNWLDEQRI